MNKPLAQPHTTSVKTEEQFRPSRVITEQVDGKLITADARGYTIHAIGYPGNRLIHECIGNMARSYDGTKVVQENTTCCPTTNLQRAKLFLSTYKPHGTP